VIASNSRPNPWLSLFAWLLPNSSLKTWALRMLGNEISDDTIIGPNLVIGCGRFRVGEGTMIEPFNLFKGLSWVSLGSRVRIGRYNQISAAPEYQRFQRQGGCVRHARHEPFDIPALHRLLGAQVVIGYHAVVAGRRTIVQSHEFDLEQVGCDGRQGDGRRVRADRDALPAAQKFGRATVLNAGRRDGAG
jgi:hypothetical protein